MKLSITMLVEDTVGRRGLLAEHGLSFWIELGSRKILFDTGQGLVLSSNACRLNIALEQADAVIISHGHYDHTGGLSEILRLPGKRHVYVHPAALEPKYARNEDGTVREIGIPLLNEQKIRERADLIFTEKPMKIDEGFFLTGPVPRQNDLEDVGGQFFTDPAGLQPDRLLDDQSAFIETPNGTVVILGCAHAGVINTLDYIGHLTGGQPLHAVLGGMHLHSASDERIEWTIKSLRQFSIERFYPMHCTGAKAVAALWTAFPGCCFPCGVGFTMKM